MIAAATLSLAIPGVGEAVAVAIVATVAVVLVVNVVEQQNNDLKFPKNIIKPKPISPFTPTEGEPVPPNWNRNLPPKLFWVGIAATAIYVFDLLSGRSDEGPSALPLDNKSPVSTAKPTSAGPPNPIVLVTPSSPTTVAGNNSLKPGYYTNTVLPGGSIAPSQGFSVTNDGTIIVPAPTLEQAQRNLENLGLV